MFLILDLAFFKNRNFGIRFQLFPVVATFQVICEYIQMYNPQAAWPVHAVAVPYENMNVF